MTTIVTRAGKGSPLTNNEVDANFTNLDTYIDQRTNPLTQAVRVAMTAAASASNGMQALDNANLRFGLGDFTLHWDGVTSGTTANAHLISKIGTYSYELLQPPTGLLRLSILGSLSGGVAANIESTVVNTKADAKFTATYTRGSPNDTVTFYVDGAQLGAAVTTPTKGLIDPETALNISGRSSGLRENTQTRQAIIYNRALSAAEVLSLCVSGPALADIEASQVGLVTGDNSTFASDTGFWVRAGGTITISGGACVFSSSTDAHSLSRSGLVSANKRYRVQYTIKNYVSGGVRTSYGLALIGATRSANGTYVEEVTVPATGNGAFYIFGESAASTTLELDDIEITQIGITGQWNAKDAQSNTGQIFDSSGNKNHALLPAAGATIIGRPTSQQQQVRWTNAWDGTNELQYIGGVNQAILPANAYIESIIGTVSGATPHDIIIGDGSDTDRYVTITTGLAAGTTSFTLANRTTDGTNLKLTVDPDTNATMSIAWVISYRILE
jgi:hypothetical protein